jgi:bacteriorhodopsin
MHLGHGRALQALAALITTITALVRYTHVHTRLLRHTYNILHMCLQAYLIMATNPAAMKLGCDGRYLQWLRYAAWGTVAPLTITYFGLYAKAHFADIAWAASLSVVAVLALFAGAVSPACISAWPLFAFAIGSGLVLVQFLWGSFRRSATASLPSGLHSTYYGTVFLFTVALVGYAVVWGTAEGGKKANETQEIIAYTVLDIVTKTLVLLIPIVNSNSYITYGSALAWAGNVKFDM